MKFLLVWRRNTTFWIDMAAATSAIPLPGRYSYDLVAFALQCFNTVRLRQKKNILYITMIAGGLRARTAHGVLSPRRADNDGGSFRSRSSYSVCVSHTQPGRRRTERHLGNIGSRSFTRINARRSGIVNSCTVCAPLIHFC